MFHFESGRMYQMPVHFGPVCGPRQNQYGERFYLDGPQDSTQHILVYETEPDAVSRFLPEGFALRMPYIIATHKMLRNLPWLAGHGYNIVTFNTLVTYHGGTETIHGQYQLAIWENHADPIISGREQLGYSKIFAEIEDMHRFHSIEKAKLSSWNFPFLNLYFDMSVMPEEQMFLKSIIDDPLSEGLLHYKYIPHTGNGFCTADTAYTTLTPKVFLVPEGLTSLPPAEHSWGTGDLEWSIPRWEDMPTQYHIVQGMASLPVKRMIGSSKVVLQHYNDVNHQRAVQ